MNEEIRTLDLFSGIGGFSLGLERAGPFRTVAFCEQDAYAQRVLRKHWPEVPIYDDVRTIDTDGLGRIDLICGGFPCQPWSVAGQQRGAEDDRDLWPAMVALVEELRPQWVIGENVRGFINQPMGLQRSLSDLARIGDDAVPFIIPACAVDAPHRRDRVWIIAHADGQSEPDGTQHEQRFQDVADTKGFNGQRAERQGNRKQRSQTAAGNSSSIVADAKGASQNEVRETERLSQQFGGSGWGNTVWLPEPDVGRVANGVPNRVDRLKCLGNAVVPQVVEQIGLAILKGWQR